MRGAAVFTHTSLCARSDVRRVCFFMPYSIQTKYNSTHSDCVWAIIKASFPGTGTKCQRPPIATNRPTPFPMPSSIGRKWLYIRLLIIIGVFHNARETILSWPFGKKIEVRSFTSPWDNRGYSKNLGSPLICPSPLLSQIFNGLLLGWTLWMYLISVSRRQHQSHGWCRHEAESAFQLVNGGGRG